MQRHASFYLLSLPVFLWLPSYATASDEPPARLFSTTGQGHGRSAALQREPLSAGSSPSVAVQAHASSLTTRTEQLLLPLAVDQMVQRGRSYSLSSGAVVWEGRTMESGRRVVSASPVEQEGGSVILVRHGAHIHGKLHAMGKLFLIQPTTHEMHELIEIDRSRMPPLHPVADVRPVQRAVEVASVEPVTVPRKGTATDPIVIHLMVNYTQAVLKRRPSIDEYIDLLVAETNRGLFASDIFVKLDVVAKTRVEYTESGRLVTDLANYRRADDGSMDEVHAQRDTAGADLNVLLVNNGDGCGQAASVGGDSSTAFAVVNRICTTGSGTFGHELGHLFGARHDPGSDSSNRPYAYGHGYQSEAGGWHTIMAYPCKKTACEEINRWSTPHQTYQGRVLGDAHASDNRRVLNERAATVAEFR
ncbi:zinc-dependent metalloprotease [Dyella sp. LX-66]|uniref:M12 family metallo-peptidase n=1 Tax=unclassified Dyella TaxID=2634549 RepID=UPI001BE0ACE4|nr:MULTISPECIES: M12 family metallo-peptidase [unclassified Dyella]MBT2115449.1 zinc-dependent metalloprotease [Dyella sp. LX-1]MBT2139264.1 zinc-dependent metalloprotease [Dyella sp. LX-66]